jgi:uncharacterized protein (TIGR02246 family)
VKPIYWFLLLMIALGVIAGNQPTKGETAMAEHGQAEAEVKNTIAALWANWVKQDVEQYTALFTEDTDWENAFGWRLRGRARLKAFLRDFLWPRQAGSQYGPLRYRVEMLTSELALAEYGVERIPPPNSLLAKRVVRTMYLLQKTSGSWQVKVTRIWDPLTDTKWLESPEALFGQYPEFKDGPVAEMQVLQ